MVLCVATAGGSRGGSEIVGGRTDDVYSQQRCLPLRRPRLGRTRREGDDGGLTSSSRSGEIPSRRIEWFGGSVAGSSRAKASEIVYVRLAAARVARCQMRTVAARSDAAAADSPLVALLSHPPHPRSTGIACHSVQELVVTPAAIEGLRTGLGHVCALALVLLVAHLASCPAVSKPLG